MSTRKSGRNDACPCGSGRKYKHCCQEREATKTAGSQAAETSVARLIDTALAHHRAGRLETAEALYQRVLEIAPEHSDALHLLGVIAHQIGRNDIAAELISRAIGIAPSAPMFCNLALAFEPAGEIEAAIECYRQALALKPDYAEASLYLANALKKLGRFDESRDVYRKTLVLRPECAEANASLGDIAKELGQFEAAVESYQRALVLRPDFAEVHCNLGLALHGLGHFEAAADSHTRALILKPDLVVAHNNLGNSLRSLGRLDAAVTCYQAALAQSPGFPEVHNNLGNALKDLGQIDAAVDHYERAISLRPAYFDAHYNLGLTWQRQARWERALESFGRALSLDPGNCDVMVKVGFVLHGLGRCEVAIECLEQVLASDPAHAEAHCCLAGVFHTQGRVEAAIDRYRTAISLKPDYGEAYCNLAIILMEQGCLEAAVEHCRQALAFAPDLAEAAGNLGNVLTRQGRLDEAIASFRQLLARKPDYASVHSNLLLAMQYVGRLTPGEVFEEHRRYGERQEGPLKGQWRPHANGRDPERRLRIGYVSGDFRNHAVAHFIEPILAHHDKSGFEISCYYNHAQRDAHTERIAGYADRWLDCARLSDDELAERIRADGIDLLIDLSGHTAHNRLPVFARKPAPVQATWIGYAGTTGLTAVDYRLTDADLDPPGLTERYHSETLIRLPGTNAAYQPVPDSPAVGPLPALGGQVFTFASLNNLTKLNAGVIALWSRLLRAVPHSRLLLGNVTDDGIRQRLRDQFAAHGIGAERLWLEPRLPIRDFLALHAQIDLALDPFPYTGGTTTCHALWMGVPVITLAGEHTVSRCGVALMSRAGLPEFIVGDEDAYLAKAVAYAHDRPALERIRQSLRARMSERSGSDAAAITRQLEAALREMWRKWSGQASL